MARLYKIAVCIPNEGSTRPEAYHNHMQWAFHLGRLAEQSQQENWEEQFDFYWGTAGRMLTPYAREQLVNQALATGMDYILMLDDDMIIYELDIFERLFSHKVDIVAPLAFMRNAPHYPVMFKTIQGYDPVVKESYYKTEVIKNYPKDKLVECDAVGFGMVLINLDVVRAMEPYYFMSTTGTGEDVYFCVQARKKGFHVFMDTAVKLGHIGSPRIITEAAYEEHNQVGEHRDTYGEYDREGYIDSSNTGKPIGDGNELI